MCPALRLVPTCQERVAIWLVMADAKGSLRSDRAPRPEGPDGSSFFIHWFYLLARIWSSALRTIIQRLGTLLFLSK